MRNSSRPLIDQQAGLAFGVGSTDRQVLLNNTVALARVASAFDLPVVISTSASKVYSGPLMAAIQAVLPHQASLERRNMNLWEDEKVRAAVLATQRRRLRVSGLLTEACVSFPVLSALEDGFEVFVVADTCGGLTAESHSLALRRMEAAGAHMMPWIQVLLELQRDWTRHETYDARPSDRRIERVAATALGSPIPATCCILSDGRSYRARWCGKLKALCLAPMLRPLRSRHPDPVAAP